jgi:hypothetical protein
MEQAMEMELELATEIATRAEIQLREYRPF